MRTYRFGPPERLRHQDGTYPFYWLYAAEDLTTALWESGFCTNDLTQPGTFHIPRDAADNGLIARFSLRTAVSILNLDGTTVVCQPCGQGTQRWAIFAPAVRHSHRHRVRAPPLRDNPVPR
ncbi:hypothetical protein MNJPNG_25190 [Cupriavidus oxalaticus]|uniref:hypothetical protein n=1 Tax=Cupriavidus oxalaticus TaxID=96344 RepID=UPI003F735CEE